MTVKELIAAVRKPGKVYMPVLMAEDVCPVRVEKADLLFILTKNYGPEAKAPWTVVEVMKEGIRLDINE